MSFFCIVYHFRSTAFLCDTILMEEEFLHFPRLTSPLDHSTYACVSSSDEECGIFSDWVIFDLTIPLMPPKRLTDYFQPAKGKPNRGMPYSLQQDNPRPAVVTLCCFFDDHTAGELPSPNDHPDLVAALLILSQKTKAIAVNKNLHLLLKYAGRHYESEAAPHFGTPCTTI